MRIRGLLVDLDGTLYSAGEPVPGAREALDRFEEAEIPVRFVTNTTRKSRRMVCEGLAEMGFKVEEDAVITPARAAASVVGDRPCHLLVADELLEDLEGVATYGDPEVVLVGDLGDGFDYSKLNPAFRALMDGAELVALQKGRYWMREDGLALDAGPFVVALEYASGKRARVVGKPERAFFEAALEDLGLPAGEVAMVGDDAEVDVAGAQRVGIKGIQVMTGKYREDARGSEDLLVESFAALPESPGIRREGGR